MKFSIPSSSIIIVISVLFCIRSTALSFPTPSLAQRISTTNTLTMTLWYEPQSKEKQSSSEPSLANADDFLQQMASNINGNIEASYSTKQDMDSLDTKAKMKQWAGNYDSAAMRAKLLDRIANNPVFLLIYGTCPYCTPLVDALKAYSQANPTLVTRQKMLIVDLDALGVEKYALRTEVMELVNHNTIPALWVGGEFIGGWEQVQELQEQKDGQDDQFKLLLEKAMTMS